MPRSFHTSLPIRCRWSDCISGKSISGGFATWKSSWNQFHWSDFGSFKATQPFLLQHLCRHHHPKWCAWSWVGSSVFLDKCLLDSGWLYSWPATPGYAFSWIEKFSLGLLHGWRPRCQNVKHQKLLRLLRVLVKLMQVPLYMTLGLAVAFALTFSIVDAGNSECSRPKRITMLTRNDSLFLPFFQRSENSLKPRCWITSLGSSRTL